MLAVGEGPGGTCLFKGIRHTLPARLQDTGIGLVGAGTLLGALLAPIIVAPLADKLGWQAAFIVTACLGFIWVPLWIAATRSDVGKALDPKPVAAGTKAPPSPGLNFRSTGIWATMVAIFFTIPPTVFTLSFLALYLSDTYGLPVKSLATLQWQPFLAMDLGQLAAAAVLPNLMRAGMSNFSARRLVIIFGFGGAALMLLVTTAPSLGMAMTWLNISRFLFQFAYVALQAYGLSCVLPEQAGRMTGLMNACFGACNFVFNPLIGKIADFYNKDYRVVLIMVSLSPLIGLVSWLILSHRAARTGGGTLAPAPATG
jgi:MFS family permease